MRRAVTTPPAATPVAWPAIGRVDVALLRDARLQFHHAVQVVNAGAISFLPPAPDDSHTNLEWIAPQAAFAAAPIGDSAPFRVALRPASMELIVIQSDGDVAARFDLAGRTIDDARQWMRGLVEQHGLDARQLTFAKHYEIPRHAVVAGAPFGISSDGRTECAGYWSGADALIRAVATSVPGASSVRCWPHHFDLATLVALEGNGTRTIGIGFSLGDNSYEQPYFYIGPYPHPPAELLPELALGHWHTEHWTGAVLTATEWLAACESEREQPVVAERFIRAAFQAATVAMGSP